MEKLLAKIDEMIAGWKTQGERDKVSGIMHDGAIQAGMLIKAEIEKSLKEPKDEHTEAPAAEAVQNPS